MAGFLLVGLQAGCGASGGDETDTGLSLTTPVITALSWSCDVAAGEWTLQVDASSWSGGGDLWLTADGSYAEHHRVRVTSSAPDGTAEELDLTLGIEADWRDVALGASTAFRCGDDPALIVTLTDRDGVVSDCRSGAGGLGDRADTVWSDVPDAPVCGVPWAP